MCVCVCVCTKGICTLACTMGYVAIVMKKKKQQTLYIMYFALSYVDMYSQYHDILSPSTYMLLGLVNEHNLFFHNTGQLQ